MVAHQRPLKVTLIDRETASSCTVVLVKPVFNHETGELRGQLPFSNNSLIEATFAPETLETVVPYPLNAGSERANGEAAATVNESFRRHPLLQDVIDSAPASATEEQFVAGRTISFIHETTGREQTFTVVRTTGTNTVIVTPTSGDHANGHNQALSRDLPWRFH